METISKYIIENRDYVNGMNRLALRLLTQQQKVFGISSLHEKEGKTTVTINLALALSKLHKKVCVIDTDMLNEKEVKTSNTLNTYLESNGDINQVLVNHGSFDYIVSETYTNSTTLLASDRFDLMLDQLKSIYDVILLDTPALQSHVDSMLVAQKSDALLVVVEEGRNTKDKLESLLVNLKRNNITILGTVLNKISNPRSLGYKPSVNKGSEAY